MKNVEISLSELRKLIQICRDLEPAGTIFVQGRAGIGKSTLIKSLEKEGWKVVELRAIYLDIGDLVTRVPDMEKKLLRKLHDEVLRKLWEYEEQGYKTVLLLDEFTQAEIPVLRMFYQLILDREVEGFKIPSRTVIIAVANTSEDADLTEITEEKPLWDRFTFRVKVYPDFEQWREWAFNNNINKMIIAFLSRFQEFFYYEEDGLHTTPRRWEMVSKVMEVDEDNKTAIMAVLGEYIGSKFVSFVELSRKFDISRLVKEGLEGLREDEKYAVLPLIASEIAKDRKQIDAFLERAQRQITGDMKVILLKFVVQEYAKNKKIDVNEAKLKLLGESRMFKQYLDEIHSLLAGEEE